MKFQPFDFSVSTLLHYLVKYNVLALPLLKNSFDKLQSFWKICWIYFEFLNRLLEFKIKSEQRINYFFHPFSYLHFKHKVIKLHIRIFKILLRIILIVLKFLLDLNLLLISFKHWFIIIFLLVLLYCSGINFWCFRLRTDYFASWKQTTFSWFISIFCFPFFWAYKLSWILIFHIIQISYYQKN